MKRPLYALFALCLASTLAHAGPGWDVTSFSTTPQNAPKLVAAMDEWMAAGGKDYPGTVVLSVNEADGNDPATHTILVNFGSVAENEAFGQKIQSNEKLSAAWNKLMNVFASTVTVVQTTRGSLLRSWGDVDPSDTVWMHHFVTANNAAAVVGALDRWANSAKGKTMPGQMHLSSVIAGGIGSPSHIISIGYASQAEMETWGDSLAGNPDFAAFMAAIQPATEYHGANLSVEVKTWGTPPAQTASR